jgi:RHS repeat-associated protein
VVAGLQVREEEIHDYIMFVALTGCARSLTDPAGNTTCWQRDLEGRVIQKKYADGTTTNYAYVPDRSLLQTRTDARNQVTHYTYNSDDSLQGTSYTNAVVATSSVATTYDTTFNRVTRQSNGWGDINYFYNPYIVDASNQAYVFVGGNPERPNATDAVNITFTNASLNGGAPWAMPSYTVPSGDVGDTSAVATHLAAYITSNSTLSAAGISATANGPLVTISAGSSVTVSPSGTGSTTATVGGGGRVAQVTNSVIANSKISYSYDALERTINRMIDGANNKITWAYDAMSRVTSELNALGSTPFTYTYVDDTSGSSKGDTRLASIAYPNGQSTTFSYLPTVQDERLQQIKNLTPSSTVLSQFNYAYNSAGEIKQWQQQQNSTNSHYDLGYDAASQLTSAVVDSGSSFKIYISGTATAGDVLSVTAYDASLTGSSGQETASYTVQSGNSLGTIATNLASNIATTMSNLSVTTSVTASSAVITVNTSPNFATSLRVSHSAGATETIALSESSPVKNLHKQYYYDYDCAGNRTGAEGDSTGTVGGGFTTTATKYSYNNVNELVALEPGGPVSFEATTTNPVKAAAVNPSQQVTIGGTVTAGDTITITVHDAALSQPPNATYVVQSGNTTANIASGLSSAINADSALSALGVSASSAGSVVTLSSTSTNATSYSLSENAGATETAALGTAVATDTTISPSTRFVSAPSLASGTNSINVSAQSGGGTKGSLSSPVSVTVSSGTSALLTYDENGNMTSDGTNTYSWDAENRLVQITYPGTGQTSTFSYDALGRNVKIVEAGSTSGTKQFVWSSDERREERDGAGSLTKQFFSRGEAISGTAFFYAKDHLGSVRETSHMSGSTMVVDSTLTYDPFGQVTQIAGTGATPDFGYAGYYVHPRSGLNLTVTRAYSPVFGRFINRDLIAEVAGTNLFAYVANDPVDFRDPTGLCPIPCIPVLVVIGLAVLLTGCTESKSGKGGKGGSSGNDSGNPFGTPRDTSQTNQTPTETPQGRDMPDYDKNIDKTKEMTDAYDRQMLEQRQQNPTPADKQTTVNPATGRTQTAAPR